MVTDALVLKHQAISIHNADQTFIVLNQFQTNILYFWCARLENKITFWKKWPSRLRVKTIVICWWPFMKNPPVDYLTKTTQWGKHVSIMTSSCTFPHVEYLGRQEQSGAPRRRYLLGYQQDLVLKGTWCGCVRNIHNSVLILMVKIQLKQTYKPRRNVQYSPGFLIWLELSLVIAATLLPMMNMLT